MKLVTVFALWNVVWLSMNAADVFVLKNMATSFFPKANASALMSQNVWPMNNAPTTNTVIFKRRHAKILAKTTAEQTLSVTQQTTEPFVNALLATKEILTSIAVSRNHGVNLCGISKFLISQMRPANWDLTSHVQRWLSHVLLMAFKLKSTWQRQDSMACCTWKVTAKTKNVDESSTYPVKQQRELKSSRCILEAADFSMLTV
jgi:hypothetical protein